MTYIFIAHTLSRPVSCWMMYYDATSPKYATCQTTLFLSAILTSAPYWVHN